MKSTNFNIQNLIDALEGTCGSIQETLEQHYPNMDESDLTQKDHDDISNEIYRCETYGW